MIQNPLVQSFEENVIRCNIGSGSNPMMVKLSKALRDKQRKRYADLMKGCVDVFEWSYEDLKTYDIGIV